MALRRPNRTVEVFDIALMAVVTKAMGAFLVLMLLMIPSYVGMPRAQRNVDEAQARAKQKLQDEATLRQQVESLNRTKADTVALLERSRARLRELGQENTSLREKASPSLQVRPALQIAFSWADCDADSIEFYVHGESVKLPDGSDWPEVRRGSQAPPASTVELRGDRLHATQLRFLGVQYTGADNPHAKMLYAESRDRSMKQQLWIMPRIVAGAAYAIYAKVGRLRATCSLSVASLVTAAETRGVLVPSFTRSGAVARSSGQILLVGRVIWSGTAIGTTSPTAAEQLALDRKFGFN